eukprot:351823-Prorocentrum_lima.AAC.1
MACVQAASSSSGESLGRSLVCLACSGSIPSTATRSAVLLLWLLSRAGGCTGGRDTVSGVSC